MGFGFYVGIICIIYEVVVCGLVGVCCFFLGSVIDIGLE